MKCQSRDNAHETRRHSAFVVSVHGKSAGQIVVAPGGACDGSNSEQGTGAERRACGLPRERRWWQSWCRRGTELADGGRRSESVTRF
jgi:hypothetical protein